MEVAEWWLSTKSRSGRIYHQVRGRRSRTGRHQGKRVHPIDRHTLLECSRGSVAQSSCWYKLCFLRRWRLWLKLCPSRCLWRKLLSRRKALCIRKSIAGLTSSGSPRQVFDDAHYCLRLCSVHVQHTRAHYKCKYKVAIAHRKQHHKRPDLVHCYPRSSTVSVGTSICQIRLLCQVLAAQSLNCRLVFDCFRRVTSSPCFDHPS